MALLLAVAVMVLLSVGWIEGLLFGGFAGFGSPLEGGRLAIPAGVGEGVERESKTVGQSIP
jgi:hypothetical protein